MQTMKPRRSTGIRTRPDWVCPSCGRRFARAKQWHSCNPRSIDSHFVGKDPALRSLFDFLVQNLKKTGPLRIDAAKTSIHMVSRHHFGGVTVRSEYLRVGFLAPKQITSARIVRTETLGPNRFAHSVVIRGKEDVDAELLGWLAGAQELQS
jgi:hypothetical protein